MSRYTAVTDVDLKAMLGTIGVDSVQELFDRQIPAEVRLGRDLDLPAGLPEHEVYALLYELAAKNVSAEDELTFLGAGMYDHYVPAIIDMLLQRSEFLTPYTPYQPEVSQGNLQAMFEYQTAISELTGLPVSNASVYEGPSAVASAGYLARLANGRTKFVVSRGLHPHSRDTLATYAHGFGVELLEVGLRDGVTDPGAWAAAIDDDASAVFFQQPNFLGAVEDAEGLAAAAKDSQAVVVGQYDPIALSVLRPPGACGVDVCVGEGQALGNRLDFGGPSFGFFAATEAHLRRMPGRIAGETTDVDGRRGFVLTLQTREQHIRREKATSNICTNQALVALMTTIFLTVYGKQGMKELGEQNLAKAHYAQASLAKAAGAKVLFDGAPRFHEFVLDLPKSAEATNAALLGEKIIGGLPLAKWYPELGPNASLWCATELTTKVQIDAAAKALAGAKA